MTTTEIPLTGLENASLKDVAWQLLIPATVQAKWNAEVEMVRRGYRPTEGKARAIIDASYS